MIKVGLTGGMGTGKATVARLMTDLGAVVIDADRLARDVVRPGSPAWREVVDSFGRGIIRGDGSIDRTKLASIVFADRVKLDRLNAIVHPPVREEMRKLLRRAEAAGRWPAAVANVPLLFEAALENEFDKIVVVTCPREEQIRRCCARDGLPREDVERRLEAQMPLEEKVKRADYVIFNGGSLEDTEKQVRLLWNKLVSPHKGGQVHADPAEEGPR